MSHQQCSGCRFCTKNSRTFARISEAITSRKFCRPTMQSSAHDGEPVQLHPEAIAVERRARAQTADDDQTMCANVHT
eukprot:1648348-Alexandrium_andersonii.AAC.1